MVEHCQLEHTFYICSILTARFAMCGLAPFRLRPSSVLRPFVKCLSSTHEINSFYFLLHVFSFTGLLTFDAPPEAAPQQPQQLRPAPHTVGLLFILATCGMIIVQSISCDYVAFTRRVWPDNKTDYKWYKLIACLNPAPLGRLIKRLCQSLICLAIRRHVCYWSQFP